MGSQIRETILAVVPADGTRIGNKKLVEQASEVASSRGDSFSKDEVEAERQRLIAEGVLGKGRGRGGSVYRKGQPVSSTGTEQAEGEAETASTQTGGIGASHSGGGHFGSYDYPNRATLRPDVGLQDQFHQVQEPTTYRYDSSLVPELAWDEKAEREFAEWLLNLVTEASEKGEEAVFLEPQCWQGTGEEFRSTRECVARLKSLSRPFLNWAGKGERQQISVPTVPLFVHERHSTRAILEKLQSYKTAGQNLDLFGDPQADIADKLDAYEHTGPWTNRMILGDSLQVMNSLLEYEGLGGQVQMIYIDPPYGVEFGSNFQPFVRKRDMRDKHGKDEWMIREPEMVKAYRDTWELGLHSYLSYLRDRLLLARELLTESGSVFVQISDENLHHVREVMDEIFDESNLVSIITLKKTHHQESIILPSVADYLIWHAKDKSMVKYNQLIKPRSIGDVDFDKYRKAELPDGSIRNLTPEERENPKLIPEGHRPFRDDITLTQEGESSEGQVPFEVDGKIYYPGAGRHWRTGENGRKRLISLGRVLAGNNRPFFKAYWDDGAGRPLNNIWSDL